VADRIEHTRPFVEVGRIIRATGLVLEAVGIKLPLGSNCQIEITNTASGTHVHYAEAEVVGFGADKLFLMPLTEISGLVPGARVYPAVNDETRGGKRFAVGMGLLGRVLNGFGTPIDGKGPITNCTYRVAASEPINPLSRKNITTQIDVGVRAINGLLSIGNGQRMGLFAGSGVGKSVLLGMMARYTSADVVVVGLIGERGREVKEFIDRNLGAEGLERAVVVAAPADNSALQRLHGATYATQLAEGFRDLGLNVLLFMDSLTRYAMAQREIALAIGEAPATKGYPPSVFAKLPALIERAGNGTAGSGSITAIYTVLTEGDDQQDPIADAARAILDGHIVLSRALADSGHYPAIDIEASVSRTIDTIVSEEQYRQTLQIKQLYSTYRRNYDLISVGAYSSGHDHKLDTAVAMYPVIENFLRQGVNEQASLEETAMQMSKIMECQE
jgi:flagellum-specific ATP synthase